MIAPCTLTGSTRYVNFAAVSANRWPTDAVPKGAAMHSCRAPEVNNLGPYGRWAFHEFTSVYEISVHEIVGEFEAVVAGAG